MHNRKKAAMCLMRLVLNKNRALPKPNQVVLWASLPDRSRPYVSDPPVWSVPPNRELALKLDRLLKSASQPDP